MRLGDTAYIIISNHTIETVKIIRIENNLIAVKLQSGGAIRLPSGRIFLSKEEAEKKCQSGNKNKKNLMGPYDFMI